jgi:hypothetical protein
MALPVPAHERVSERGQKLLVVQHLLRMQSRLHPNNDHRCSALFLLPELEQL